jgi:transcriptional regulator with XRE-family HTH domain
MTGPQLRALRDSAGYTQQELADALGVDRVSVNRWEQGARTIPLAIAIAVEHVTGCVTTASGSRPRE